MALSKHVTHYGPLSSFPYNLTTLYREVFLYMQLSFVGLNPGNLH
jgi:hypothetical protein